MKYLLDTHAFIWMDSSPGKLSKNVQDIIREPDNDLILSMASVWEMQIKLQLGKLTLPVSLPDMIVSQQKINVIELLPILLKHILGLDKLSHYHRDPFDRLLISQAMTEKLPVITRDNQFLNYPVTCIW